MFTSFIVMMYGSETWPMRVEELRRLERAERTMIRTDVQSDIEGQMQE